MEHGDLGSEELLVAPKRRRSVNQASKGSNWIRKKKRHAIYERDGRKCVYCGSDGPLTLDHLVPNKCNKETNLVTACSDCNTRKKSKSWKAFVLWNKDHIAQIEKLRRRKLKYVAT